MRILHLIPHLSGGGAERQLNDLALEMAKLGHDVHIAYLETGPEEVFLDGVNLHRLTVSGNHSPMLFHGILNVIRRTEPDIIQSWIQMMDIVMGMFSFTHNVPWVLREPSSSLAYARPNVKRLMRTRLARRAAAIVCNSSDGKSYWLAQGVADHRLHVIPNGIGFSVMGSVDRPMTDRNFGMRLIYAGRLTSSKNVDLVIEALAQIKHHERIFLLIAGEGPEKANLMAMVKRFGLSKTVTFAGLLPSRELWAQMKAADAFVSLSSYEGMPNCVCEAVACGLPVILSDIPAHRNLLADDAAFLVSVNSIGEVKDQILHVLRDSRDAGLRAVRALQRLQDFTTESVAAKYVNVYEEILRRWKASAGTRLKGAW
jgi:glycosyltransferase involved in cell wall biosynthesis